MLVAAVATGSGGRTSAGSGGAETPRASDGAERPRARVAAAGMRHAPAGGPWLMPAGRTAMPTAGGGGERLIDVVTGGSVTLPAGSDDAADDATAASEAAAAIEAESSRQAAAGTPAAPGATMSTAQLLARTAAGCMLACTAAGACRLTSGGELAERCPSPSCDAMASTYAQARQA